MLLVCDWKEKRRKESKVVWLDWNCLFVLIDLYIPVSVCSGVEWNGACVHVCMRLVVPCLFVFLFLTIASHHIAPHRITHNSSSSNATTITSYHITSHNISYHMHSIYEWHGTAKYYYFERNRPEPKPIALHSIFLTSCERTRTNWIELNWTQSLI